MLVIFVGPSNDHLGNHDEEILVIWASDNDNHDNDQQVVVILEEAPLRGSGNGSDHDDNHDND